jgi:calcineurin-like phosphoesterase family protein
MSRQVWFTSDTHFGHARIAEFCPNRLDEFAMDSASDIGKMNEMMIVQWNEQVGPDDMVVHLGDFAMGQIADTLQIARRLNGYKTLILGNHDRPHPSYSRPPEKREGWAEKYREVGFDLSLGGHWDFDGIPTTLCHFPYTGDSEGVDRYPEYRPEDHGMVLVHGHIHDMWVINGRQVNVGMDAHGGRLLSEEEVADLVTQAALN